jgi:phospholipid-binding lipoprotein MlaA
MTTRLSRLKYLLAAAIVAMAMTGCATTPTQTVEPMEPMFTMERLGVEDTVESPLTVAYDPWEPFNRRVYAFNAQFDRFVWLPIVRGYQWLLPDYIEERISDWLHNQYEVRNVLASLFQLKLESTAYGLQRLVFNSTFGVFGLWDVATALGINERREDFGQVFGHWGAGPGPYLVLPFLGPSSLRDGLGYIPDFTVVVVAWDPILPDAEGFTFGSFTLAAINGRREVPFRYYETGSPFEYELVRRLFLTKREIEIAK